MIDLHARKLPPFAYWLLPAALVLISLAGYLGYVLYPRFDLSPATGMGLLALAAAAGVASFFSPCSFPLLVTLLAAGSEREQPNRAEPWRFALGMALGAGLFLLMMGSVIAVGGETLFADITFTSTSGRVIRFAAGALLIGLGLLQLNVIRGPDFHRLETHASGILGRAVPERRPAGRMAGSFGYGFGYVLTGVG